MTDTFTWRVEIDASGGGEFDIVSTPFGDGYVQETARGINNQTQEWQVSYAGYREAVMEVLQFIRDKQGLEAFFWTAPLTNTPSYYKCKSYKPTDMGGGYWRLSLTFVEYPQP